MIIGETVRTFSAGANGLSASAREKLIVDHLPLVRHILSKVAARLPAQVDREDLLEAGVIGLIAAADRFDPARNVKFHTYATTRVRGAMLDALRENDWLPRSLRTELDRLGRAREAIERETHRPPTADELCRRARLGRRKLAKLNRVAANCSICSFDDLPAGLLADSGDATGARRSAERRPEDRAMLEEARERLAAAIPSLSKTERLVISLYYFEQLSLGAIAGMIGVTSSRVCQIHRGALKELQRLLKEPAFEMVAATA